MHYWGKAICFFHIFALKQLVSGKAKDWEIRWEDRHEVAELVNLMTDRANRAEAMQHYTMASSSQCPPAVLLTTESKAELNAGLIIITGHTATQLEDIDMDTETPDASMPAASACHPEISDTRAHKSRRLAHPADRKSPEEWVTELRNSRASFLATTVVPEDPAEALRGGLILTPLLGCKARTPLDWTHAWAMLGEWAGKIAFPIPEDGRWPRHGHGIYLRPDYIHRTPPFLTWARPIFEQGALSPMSVLPADFPILCLPGDKLFQSKDVETTYCLPPVVHAFYGSKVEVGKKLQQWQKQGLRPLAVALIGSTNCHHCGLIPQEVTLSVEASWQQNPTWLSNGNSPGRKFCYSRAYGRQLNVPTTAITTHHGLTHAKPRMSSVDKTPACNFPMTRSALYLKLCRHDCESNPATLNWL